MPVRSGDSDVSDAAVCDSPAPQSAEAVAKHVFTREDSTTQSSGSSKKARRYVAQYACASDRCQLLSKEGQMEMYQLLIRHSADVNAASATGQRMSLPLTACDALHVFTSAAG